MTGVSRRGLVAASGALAGVAGAAGKARAGGPASSLRGPCLDLTTPRGAATAEARLTADLAPGAGRFGGLDGSVMAVAQSGHVTALCGYRAVEVSWLRPAPGGRGWRRLRREIGVYYDLASDKPLTSLRNPFTGEMLHVPAPAYELQDEIAHGPLSVWRLEGDRLMLEEHRRLDHATLRGGDRLIGSQWVQHVVALSDMQNPELTRVASVGGWTRTTDWPAWLGMAGAPGHCIHRGRFAGGMARIEDLPPRIAAHPLETAAGLLTAPAGFAGPGFA